MQDTDPTLASRHDSLTDWLRLASASGVGLQTAHALLAHFGSPGAIFAAGQAALTDQVGARLAHALGALLGSEDERATWAGRALERAAERYDARLCAGTWYDVLLNGQAAHA